MTTRELRENLQKFEKYLFTEEYAEATIRKYIFDVNKCLGFMGKKNREVNKEYLRKYKSYLLSQYSPSTVNSYMISINKYLKWNGLKDLQMKTIRIQKKTCLENVISTEEYMTLLDEAKRRGKIRDYLIMRAMAMTGIRVGELKYITVDSVRDKKLLINNKGKYRTVYLPVSLCELLERYCRAQQIDTGMIFTGSSRDKSLSESAVWKMLKKTAESAGIDKKNVYPHSFRHLFAKTYMKKVGNIMELADILGHSNVEITRIYAVTTAEEKRQTMECLDL